MKLKHHYLLTIVIALLTLTACNKQQITLDKLSDDAVILAFGDSLTYGTGANTDESYPHVLSGLLNRTVINSGIPGELSANGLKRLPSLLDSHSPELLILCHGANDILRKRDLKKATDNLKQMVELAQTRNIPVILIGVPEFSLFLNTAEFYQDIADEYKLLFIKDILSKILSNASLKADPVHPNKAGYKMMAETIFNRIQKAKAL